MRMPLPRERGPVRLLAVFGAAAIAAAAAACSGGGGPQAFELGAGQVIPGFQTGLTGQRVGSRVLLVIPPRLGYGTAGDPPLVTGKDTLVYVVDILAALLG